MRYARKATGSAAVIQDEKGNVLLVRRSYAPHDLRGAVVSSVDAGVRKPDLAIFDNAVHPGQIDLKDDAETALGLFDLLNLIVDRMITEERRIAEMYGRLPETIREAIAERDAPKA